MAVKGILFEIGGQSYGLDLLKVAGIEPYMSMMVVPNAPECIEGIINLRKKLIPIYNLRTKFHLPKIAVTPETKIIVARTNGVPVGYLVDRVKEIQTFEEEDISQAPFLLKSQETEYIQSVAFLKDGLAILLEPDHILLPEERERIWKILEDQKKIVADKEKNAN